MNSVLDQTYPRDECGSVITRQILIVRVISAPYSTFVISLNSRRMWLPTRVNSGEEV